MTVSLAPNGDIRLSGVSPLEEAEELLRLLIDYPEGPVDWRSCESCHSAVLQVLIAARPRMIGPPRGNFLKQWVNLD